MKKYKSFYKLLRGTDVNEVLQAVESMYYANEPQNSFPYAYKGAYDQLVHMQPDETTENEDGGAIRVSQSRFGEEKFALTNCEGMKWETAIRLPVVVDDTIELTPAETVAAIIWALTYYGFSEREINKFFDDLDKEIEEGATTPYDFCEDDEEDDVEEACVELSPEEEERRRLEERDEKVEQAMMKLLSQSQGLTVKDLLYLLDTSLIYEIYPHTYAFDTAKRMDYLLDLLDNYCKVGEGYDRVVLCVTSSPIFPITEEEEKRLVEKLKEMVHGGEVLLAKRQHIAIGKELETIILFSKD